MPCERGGEDGVSFPLPRASACLSWVPGEVEAPAMGLEPRPPQGPERGLGTSLQPRQPGHACSPALSRNQPTSSSSVASLVWRLHVATLGPESSGQEQPPCRRVPALLVSSPIGCLGASDLLHQLSLLTGVWFRLCLGLAIPVDGPSPHQPQPPSPRGPAGPCAVFSDAGTLCSPESA